MKPLKIEGNAVTPEVCLDDENNIFIISGRSLPEDPAKFYAQIIAWFEDYYKNPNESTVIGLDFEYLNSSSIKQLSTMLLRIDELDATTRGTRIRWYFEEGDVESQKRGEHFSKLVSIPFITLERFYKR